MNHAPLKVDSRCLTVFVHGNTDGGDCNVPPYQAMRSTLQCIHCVQKKNTYSHFLSYLHDLFVDLNKNYSEYTQGLIDSDNVKIRYSLRSMT